MAVWVDFISTERELCVCLVSKNINVVTPLPFLTPVLTLYLPPGLNLITLLFKCVFTSD